MSNPTYFVQECPTCGRSLQIRVEYLGRKVVCQHCQGALTAADPTMRCDCGESKKSLLRRAEELLAAVSLQKMQARTPHPR
jgi:Zn finger protein HypA/HybF involved in hydrogenase expression